MELEEITEIKGRDHKHTEELVDHYWGSITYVSSLIKASEIKAGLILSFYGISLNFSYKYIEILIETAASKTLLYVLLGAWFASTITSIYFSVRCFMPRIETAYEKNIFFFGDVISKFGSITEFSKIFYKISLNEQQLFDQLGQQIYVISKIAAIKFSYVNKSFRFLAISLFLLLVLLAYNLISTSI
ncbi:MAG TPA: Pycsar system effector family protein [Xanthomarina sp.]|nr:Pycsar system effector family protein [Xanthomarina sp.]